MLKRIADETTIHGVKYVWRSDWIGRVFFLTVSVGCFTVAVFQLKGLFHGYISEAVGTRVISSMKSDTIEIPSFYYCNKNWLPSVGALSQYNPILNVLDSKLNKSYDLLYKECVQMARYNISLYPFELPQSSGFRWSRQKGIVESKQHCDVFLEYWKSMIKQDLVNAIVQPFEDRSFDYRMRLYDHRQRRPELSVMTTPFAAAILADPIQSLLNSNISHSLQAFVENFVLNTTLDEENDNRNCTTCSVRHISSSSIMSQILDRVPAETADGNLDFYLRSFLMKRRHYDRLRGYGSGFSRYDALANSILHPSAVSTSLDGVCLEYPAGPSYLKTKVAVGRKHRHVVMRLGGFVHQLRTLNSRFRTFDHPVDRRDYYYHFLKTVINYAYEVGDDYHTYVAVSKQNEPGLYFNQKVRVDSTSRLVNIKYWTKSYSHINRKAWTCRPEPWTELDQAHCNQELLTSRGEKVLCETYLTASGGYTETAVTNNTCIYDHTGLFQDITLAMSELKLNATVLQQPLNITHRLSSFRPTRLSYDHRRDVIDRLTNHSRQCPRPCSRKVFNHQVSYPSPPIDKAAAFKQECHMALAYWLTPQIFPSFYYDPLSPNFDSPKEWFEMQWTLMSRAARGNSAPFCSVIEFEQTEAQGEISEEYLLYGFSDLAANLGGTFGLWIGASVISIAQLAYLLCLETQFRKFWRLITFWQANKFVRGTRSIAPAAAEHYVDASLV